MFGAESEISDTLPLAPARCVYVIVGDPEGDPEPETPFAHISDRLIAATPALQTISLLPIELHESVAPLLYTRLPWPLVPRHAVIFLRASGLEASLPALRRYPFVAFFLLTALIPLALADRTAGHVVVRADDEDAGNAILSTWRRDAIRATDRLQALGWPADLIQLTRASAARFAQAERLSLDAPTAVPPHRCLTATGLLINRAKGYWGPSCHGARGAVLNVGDVNGVLDVAIAQAGELASSPRSISQDVAVIVPSFNPHYYSGLQNYVTHKGGPPTFVTDLVNNSGYLQVFSEYDADQERHRQFTAAAAYIRQSEVEFHDAAALLYMAGRHRPVIRTPQLPGRLFEEMDRVASLRWDRSTAAKSVDRWSAFGDQLSTAIGPGLIAWLAANARRVLAYCDLPIEWCMSDGVPLGYLTRVNRIPLSPGNAPIMPVVDLRPPVEWTTVREVRVLICDAHEQRDPLRHYVQVISEAARSMGFETFLARVDSERTFLASFAEYRPNLVIFSGHGNLVPAGATLSFAAGEGLLRHDELPFSPDAAIICACRSDAVTKTYGSPASRLFMAGVRAVVGTYLKISEPHASLVVVSMLSYIASGMSGEQRIATFGEAVAQALQLRRPVDILVAAADWCRKRRVRDPDDVYKLFAEYVREHNARRVARRPRDLWRGVESTLVRLAQGTPYREAIDTIIANRLYRPESQFYTVIGDADRILLGPQYPQLVARPGRGRPSG
jgi:hypothetical protein